jgi:DMSO/TMAO reductase YedYZ molybdopterin-dependent catalytic subunit
MATIRDTDDQAKNFFQVPMGTLESYKWHLKWFGNGGQRLLSRRIFVASAFAGLVGAQKAEVSSFDFSLLDEWAVPNDLFFVRDHFQAPNVSSAGWNLSVSGSVRTPLNISFNAVSSLPRKVLAATMECAENPVGGGLVSHAEWTGFALASVVEPAPEARWARLSGADGFSRCIPIEKALHGDTLIAYSMNGEKLPVNHGFPMRAMIPGWYGMDSVKWLQRIELLPTEDRASEDYVKLVRSLLTGTRPAARVSAMHVKSAFARPLDGAILINRRFTVRGAAWAGENRVRQVEVSTDAGKSWGAARLGTDPLPYAWVQWTHEWRIPGPGQYELMVRAEDDVGRRQPKERAADRADGYELNSYQAVRVTVI